jgi:hypothetical protein
VDTAPDPTDTAPSCADEVQQGSGTKRVDNLPATGTLRVGRGSGVCPVLDEHVDAWDASPADGAVSDGRCCVVSHS